MALALPPDVLNGLKTALESDPEAHARVLFFLADSQAAGNADPYIQSLQAVVNIPAVFKKVAERMEQDTRTAENDPGFRQVMHDVWNNFMKDNLSEHLDDGQRWALAIPDTAMSATVQHNFMRAVANLPPESFIALQNVIQSFGAAGPVALYADRALATARKAMPVVRVALVAVFLAWDVIKNIKRWWNGEISGKRCVKNIIDCGVSIAAGIVGGIGGETVGAAVGAAFGPVGMAVGAISGAVAGGVAATQAANALCDRLTQWVFGLPKSEALDKAYSFMDVSPTASNSDINSRYRHLALEYHPDKGGSPDKWTQLQYSMAVIREARGEP